MILPNAMKDTHGASKEFIDDPLFNSIRDASGEQAFRDEVVKTCAFLSQWVWSPGIKGSPTSQGELTLGDGAVDFADLVACSGHGCSGIVWGGDYELGCHLGPALKASAGASATDRLKYVLIPTCYNLSQWNRDTWLPVLRRSSPVHGLLGYSQAYPGDNIGHDIFERFADNLKADGGRMSILEAFKRAHTGWLGERWGAILHASAKTDTMRDWLAGKLASPSPSGELRWFCGANWPDGERVEPVVPPYSVHYVVGGERITADNHLEQRIGLMAGKAGALEVKSTSGTFSVNEELEVTFFYYRPEKDGMDLDKLLEIGTSPDATATVVADMNKRDSSAYSDGVRVRVTKPGLSTITIPFTVRPTAHQSYSADGQNGFGYFWLRLKARGSDYSQYTEGAWLRAPVG
jgi:hypothetical protein